MYIASVGGYFLVTLSYSVDTECRDETFLCADLGRQAADDNTVWKKRRQRVHWARLAGERGRITGHKKRYGLQLR